MILFNFNPHSKFALYAYFFWRPDVKGFGAFYNKTKKMN